MKQTAIYTVLQLLCYVTTCNVFEFHIYSLTLFPSLQKPPEFGGQVWAEFVGLPRPLCEAIVKIIREFSLPVVMHDLLKFLNYLLAL